MEQAKARTQHCTSIPPPSYIYPYRCWQQHVALLCGRAAFGIANSPIFITNFMILFIFLKISVLYLGNTKHSTLYMKKMVRKALMAQKPEGK